MRYVLLGTLAAEWAARKSERVDSAKAKMAELGITIESVHFTQGEFDFVDVVEAPDPTAILAFSLWYVAQGYGRIRTMPAFDEAEMDEALKRV